MVRNSDLELMLKDVDGGLRNQFREMARSMETKHPELVVKMILETVKKKNKSESLVRELERMFRKHPKGFYRHFEEREDQVGLDGDCWRNILGYTNPTFKKRFGEIGCYYLSMEEFDATPPHMRFGYKFYLRVVDVRNHNRTLYLRNHGLISALFAQKQGFVLDDDDMGLAD